MNDTPAKARDYSETLFLPKTDFPMRGGLPQLGGAARDIFAFINGKKRSGKINLHKKPL